ncbi:hypothetical protein MY04_05820 (plasmid) [Flammeovirga sp. MY04]|uniref:hypothetical protein n=1 Tax=Flammeovirga sp. MY04 TaxID=1191459 RepID=UPI0008063652|nr:hypothetical protein [Flammeovirga sp. MY04]ANQ52897.1 hypothetical protein MY04_05820 [Flammeovirga sp. MY04]
MRLRTGEVKTEAIIFFIFIGLNLLSLDLIANGFWTTYNKAFATFSHVRREKLHDPSPLFLTVQNKLTGEFDSGYVIEAKEKEAQLYLPHASKEKKFLLTDNETYKVVDFKHTDVELKSQRIVFEEISLDSLNRLLDAVILELTVFSNLQFYHYKEGVKKVASNVSMELVTSPKITALEDGKEELKNKLQLIHEKLKEERNNEAESRLEFKSLKRELATLEGNFDGLSDYQKGKAIKEINQLEKEVEGFEVYQADTLKLKMDEQVVLEKLGIEGVFSGVVIQIFI